ncbi:MAG TPA: CarD family transcriptional regulator [Alphaproteobacteria bacterium]
MDANFKLNERVVHPNHGVGFIGRTELKHIAGQESRFIVVEFPRTMLVLRIPEEKLARSGLRRPSSVREMRAALSVLPGRPVEPKGSWSHRAAEYGQRLNSGEPKLLAEIVRDLNQHQGRRWASAIYHEARLRLAEELAVVDDIAITQAESMLEQHLVADGAEDGRRSHAARQR